MLDFYYFEWDQQKARSNILKHGITFDSATTVFHDPNMISLFDEKHSDDEDGLQSGWTKKLEHLLWFIRSMSLKMRVGMCG